MTPTTWRLSPFSVAMVVGLASLRMMLGGEVGGAYAWTLAAFAGWQLLAGVGEFVERRVKRAAVRPGQQHEAPAPGEVRMLVGSCIGQQVVVLDRAGQWLPPEAHSYAREIIRIQPPSQRGLYVWEGRFVDMAAGERETTRNYRGTWRRATPEEAQRYAAGEPVWGAS